ncbi:MAG: metal ABC transporter permease [Solirubrobacteraceae bacterium]
MFAHAFARNALIAGSLIALASGLAGYFVVLRAQVFAGDALSHVAFTGAIAAALVGVDERIGLFVSTVLVAVALGALGRRAEADDVTIGTVLCWVLGLGVLFLALVASGAGGGNGVLASRQLFGSIFSLSAADTLIASLIAVAIIGGVLAIARPLLFASLDPEVARAHGVPVRTLSVLFLGLVGLDAGEATQAVGALLLLGLLSAPAGAASRLTTNPYLGLALSALFALGSVWVGLTLSYQISALPPSSAIIAVASAVYAVSFLATRRRTLENRPPALRPRPAIRIE